MIESDSGRREQVRAAEVIAVMCLATDIGMGFPFEHGLEGTLMTMRLCDALDVDSEVASRAYYASLLMYAGCTVDEAERTAIFGGGMTENITHRQFGSLAETLRGVIGALPDPEAAWPRRGLQIATGLPRGALWIRSHFAALCEVAGMLAERVGVPESVYGMFPFMTERWDGGSILRRASGDAIPLPVRIIHVARDAAYQRLRGDDQHVRTVIRSRAGHAFDPEIAQVFLDRTLEILGPPDPSPSVWDDVLAAEPRPWLNLEGDAIDRALEAIGAFSDLVSPYLSGHCSRVAALAARAAEIHGFEESEIRSIRRGAFVHDVGRMAVPNPVWDKPGPLSAHEREQVRLHPYHTDRVLARSTFLTKVSAIASAHHERLDGSGYHRGLDASSLTSAARLLAVADAFQSKLEPRSYRAASTPEEARDLIAAKAEAGMFDPVMVKAVAEAAGETPPRLDRPAGLTDREVEVLGLLARGLRTKQIARELDISPKTVDRHIQNSYRKIGVSSRAAATLFAAENGLISS